MREVDPEIHARGCLRQAPRLVALPASTARAARIAQDPESSLEELAQAFTMDPALCSHLLKVANSAFYGLQTEVSTIERAAVVLGRKVLRNVALAASMQAIVHRVDVGRAFSVDALWRHSIRTAAASSVIASEGGAWEANESFAAGLIHDLGLLVALETQGECMESVLSAARSQGDHEGDGLCELERASMGADHQYFGEALCEAWSFPPALRIAASHHHRAADYDGPERHLAAVVRVAELLCGSGDHGLQGTEGGGTIAPILLELTGLQGRDLKPLAEHIQEVGDELESAFGSVRRAA